MRILMVGLVAAFLVGCKKPPEPAPVVAAPPVCGAMEDGRRVFRVLHLNDVYRTEGLADGRGGLARVRTLRTTLEEGCEGGVLVTHGGDALFPSLPSRSLKGAQMIEALNLLDGDADAFDERLVLTFGNHEFDKSKAKDAAMLQQRIDESGFAWLDTNLTWAEATEEMVGIRSEKLHTERLLDIAGVKVGLFSLTIGSKVPAYVSYIDDDHTGVARTRSTALREQGADVVIALTHLNATDDIALLDALGPDGPDLVLGAHDHVLQTHEVDGRLVLKGDADAVRVRVAEITVDPEGGIDVRVSADGVELGPELPPRDPAVQAVIDARLAAFQADFCGEDGPDCLSRPLSVARTDLVAEEYRIRTTETNLGDWVADLMRESFAEDGVQIALMNSGGLRLNQNIASGTPLTRQIVEELFAYPSPMDLIEIDGATLQQVLDHSVEDWTGSGHWLQVSGLAFRHDRDAGRAVDAALLTPDGPIPLDPDATYRVVTVRYLLDPGIGDQDGYDMLSLDQRVEAAAGGRDLKQVVLDALTTAGDEGIAPRVEGRICAPDGPCLLD